MNIGVHVSFSTLVSSGYMPSSGIAESYGSFIPSFCHLILTGLAPKLKSKDEWSWLCSWGIIFKKFIEVWLIYNIVLISVAHQSDSVYIYIMCVCVVVVQSLSHVRFCDPMDCRTPGFPVLHHLPELAQTHVHWVGDAIQPSHFSVVPFSSAFNLSQHQGLS